MRGSTVKILDDKYADFIDVLQRLGELHNIVKLIVHLSEAYWHLDNADSDLWKIEAGAAMRTLWENGWIEVCEIKRQSKGTLRRTHKVRINLEKITCYFKQEKAHMAMLAGRDEARALY